jgi:xylan 1,4-beta-xylosidase
MKATKLILIFSIFFSSFAHSQNQTITFSPAWNEAGSTFRHTWEGLGNVDQFRWMVRGDMQEQLAMAHKDLKMKHVRAVGIFDEEMKVFALDPTTWREKDRKPRYNWQVIDYVIQSLLDRGMSPMITTTFTPYLMASGEQYCFSTKSNVTPPKDYNQWADLVTKTTQHFVERFGLEVVKGWYFEVWNEPNLDAFWKGADKQEYFKLWNATYNAIKSVDKSFRIGGPSAARGEWIREFIEYGRANACEPDYIITHVYNNDSPFSALSPFDGPQGNKENDSPHFLSGVVKGVRKMMDEMNYKGEVHFNEWGRSWYPSDNVRETANEAAFIVKSMAETSQLADYFAYWCISDIYDQLGYASEAFAGTYGMLNMHGLKKPSYKAHEMLTALGNKQLTIKSAGADEMINGIATRSDKGYQFLYYAMDKNYTSDSIARTVTFTLDLPAKAKNIKIYKLGSKDNNVIAAWKAMGSPAYLKPEQLNTLKHYNQLLLSGEKQQIIKNKKSRKLSIEAQVPGIVLVTMDK